MSTKTLATKDELQAEVEKHHQAVVGHAQSMLISARECGKALRTLRNVIKAQNLNWKTWCETHLPFSYSRAAEYMRLATRWQEVEGEWKRNPELSINQALQLLTTYSKKRPPAPLIPWGELYEETRKDELVAYAHRQVKATLGVIFSEANLSHLSLEELLCFSRTSHTFFEELQYRLVNVASPVTSALMAIEQVIVEADAAGLERKAFWQHQHDMTKNDEDRQAVEKACKEDAEQFNVEFQIDIADVVLDALSDYELTWQEHQEAISLVVDSMRLDERTADPYCRATLQTLLTEDSVTSPAFKLMC